MQHRAEDGTLRVIAARGGEAGFVAGMPDIRSLALHAIELRMSLDEAIARCGVEGSVDPARELAAGRLAAPIGHPDPAHVFLTGTGLTHLGSAEGRDKMH